MVNAASHLKSPDGSPKWSAQILLVAVSFFCAAGLLQAQEKAPVRKGVELKKEGITAYIVRDSSLNTIKLTMLIGHNPTLTRRIQKMVGRKVTPLIFSVSTLPGQSTYFNPVNLRFYQDGREWSPDSAALDSSIIMLEEKGRFGGVLHGGETHQAVILLPGWFNPSKSIIVHYDDRGATPLQLTQTLVKS